MFIGREKELALCRKIISERPLWFTASAALERLLIRKALESCQYQKVYFECLKSIMQDNINGFVQELVRAKVLPVPLSFSTLQDVFTYLNALPQKIVVVIDEYPISNP